MFSYLFKMILEGRLSNNSNKLNRHNITPDRRQSKTLSIIDERGSKIDRNRVFDYHLSPHWRQMVIENPVSIDF